MATGCQYGGEQPGCRQVHSLTPSINPVIVLIATWGDAPVDVVDADGDVAADDDVRCMIAIS